MKQPAFFDISPHLVLAQTLRDVQPVERLSPTVDPAAASANSDPVSRTGANGSDTISKLPIYGIGVTYSPLYEGNRQEFSFEVLGTDPVLVKEGMSRFYEAIMAYGAKELAKIIIPATSLVNRHEKMGTPTTPVWRITTSGVINPEPMQRYL